MLDLHPAKADPGSRFASAAQLARKDVDEARTIRVPIHLMGSLDALRRLSEQLGREPTPEEYAAETGRDVEKARTTISKLRPFLNG